ncbi:MAG: hypothetical protein PHW13_04435 [Methylococcales bacterium]|nr:hypothetical protein [Methylococcales bacterium]
MNHLKNLLEGARQVLTLRPESSYIRPDRGGFARDAAKLRADSGKIAQDLNGCLRKYGK